MSNTLKPTIAVVRAVGVEFARRTLRPFLIAGTVAAVLLLALGGWLTTISAWWWILEFVFICATLLFIALSVGIRLALRKVAPKLSKAQRSAVGAFVDKLERVAEHLQTPQPVIIFRVIRDAVRPQRDSFIETVSRDSHTLAPDFNKLRRDFADEQ